MKGTLGIAIVLVCALTASAPAADLVHTTDTVPQGRGEMGATMVVG